jgi:uncharacterized protein YndB with AHSA1/START domain
MLKWTLIVVLGLGGVVGLVALVGLALPKGHRAAKTTVYAASPEVVFAAIADVRQYAEWRSDVKRIEMLPDDEERTMFREFGRQGAMTYRIDVAVSPSRLVFRIVDPSLPFSGTWTHELRPAASGGTELTTTEEGDVYNPIFRVMSTFFFSPTATLEKYHAALAQRVERPRP